MKKKNILFLKAVGESYTTTLENDSEYQRITSILKSINIANAQDHIDLEIKISELIDKIPNATSDFVNKDYSQHIIYVVESLMIHDKMLMRN